MKQEYRSPRDLPSWERIEEKIPGIRDQIIDVIEEEVGEDLSLMTGAIGQEIAEESTLKISKARLPC